MRVTFSKGRDLPHLGARLLWVLIFAAVTLVPPARTAAWARSSTDESTVALVTGLWMCKALILLNLLAIPLIRRWFQPDVVERSGERSGRLSRREQVLLGLLVVVALALRWPGVGAGLWLDEIQTQLDYVRLPWGKLLTTFDTTNQHLLYSISARAVQLIGGESATTLRLPAVLFGVASIWAALVFGLRWMPRREAWWSIIVLTVSYHHVWFSQSARGYTALLLGALLSSALFLDLLRGERSEPRTIWSYAVIMALTLLTHVTALTLVAGHGLTWLWQARALSPGRRRWAPFAALVLAGMLTAALYAPIIPQVIATVDKSGSTGGPVVWQNPTWFVAETVRALVSGVPAGKVLVPMAGLAGVLGLWMAWRQAALATMLMLLPMIILAGLILAAGHNLWPRFFFFGAGFLVQFAVRGGFGVLDWTVGRWRPPLARRIGDGGLVAVALASIAILPRAWKPKQDYEQALAWVEQHRQQGDAIVATFIAGYVANDWLHRTLPIVEDTAGLHQQESLNGQTLVLYTFPIRLQSVSPDLWKELQTRYQPVFVVPSTVAGGEIVIVSRSAHTPSPSRTQ
jgi:mannosyltransferase